MIMSFVYLNMHIEKEREIKKKTLTKIKIISRIGRITDVSKPTEKRNTFSAM